MLTQITGTAGVITYSKQIVDQVVDLAFAKQEGRIWLANYKGTASDMRLRLGGLAAIAEKKASMRGGKLHLDLFSVTRLGESISGCCFDVMSDIAEMVTGQLELPIDNIEITVTGILSKNGNIAKRNIVLNYRDMLNGRKSFHE